MKKVFIVSKTHLDLGFTDYAENVLKKYLEVYIPGAVRTAQKVNTKDEKRFVWTTGSWLLKKALENDRDGFIENALRNGDIAPHAMPFTIHTELLDGECLDYALGLVDEIDKITGRKTTAAKMTDVPGHTKSLIPLLAKHGIKLLHIGVNGASAMPEVPECFLWRHESGAEVAVIYSGSYGGEFRCDLTDEILYFDHTVDNRGARNEKDTIAAFEKVKVLYPGYEVTAGRMDDYADAIWEKRSELPVVTSEIGDTWIHGGAADPYKSGCLRELMRLRKKGIENGCIDITSKEYEKLMESILCVAEHTCGGDSKVFLSDYSHYDKESFTRARENDDVTQSPEIEKTEYGIDVIEKRKTGEYNEGSYRAIEKAWQEQRNYLLDGLSALPEEMRKEAAAAFDRLKPERPEATGSTDCREISSGKIKVICDENGAIDIYNDKTPVFESRGRVPFAYMAFSADDYDGWLSSYTRDFEDNHIWSLPDFARPFLHSTDGKYAFGEYSPKVSDIFCSGERMVITYTADSEHSEKLGCARTFQLEIRIENDKIKMRASWFEKDASRIPEATFFRLFPVNIENLTATKCGGEVDVSDIVRNGSRRLFACHGIAARVGNDRIKINNLHSPLCIPGFCNLVRFSNDFPSPQRDGISFVLHDSIWGTNFPLWYSDNAAFEFEIEIE